MGVPRSQERLAKAPICMFSHRASFLTIGRRPEFILCPLWAQDLEVKFNISYPQYKS